MERRTVSRPAVWIGFSCFGGLLAAAFLPLKMLPCLCLSLLFAAGILILTKISRRAPAALLVLISLSVSFGVYSVLSWFTVLPPQRYAGNQYQIQAEILSEGEKRYGNHYYTARVFRIEDTAQDVDFRVRLSHTEALNADIDDTVQCTVRFYTFEDAFGLSSRTAQLAENKVLGAYISGYDSITVQPAEKHSLRFYCSAVRRFLDARLQAALPPDEASILSAMLLGLRTDLSDTLRRDYTSAGASHILVISGMHMAIISNFVLSAFLFLRMRRRMAAGITIVFILVFMAISGFSVSVVRSGIMQILLLLGILIGRTTDALNSLAIALLVLMISNPFCTADVSLLLSFSATLGILVLSPRMIQFLTGRIRDLSRRKMMVRLCLPLVSAVSAVLGSLPVQLFVFGTLNFSSILSSLLVLYISAWIVRIGALAVSLLGIPVLSGTASPFLFASGLLVRLQNGIIRWIASKLPLQLELSGSYLPGTVILIVLFFLLAFWLYRGKQLPVIVYFLSAVLLFGGAFFQHTVLNAYPRLLTADYGYAQCTALIHGDRAVVLLCDGSGEKAASALRSSGVRELSILHYGEKESEIRCADVLLQEFPTGQVLLPESVYWNSDHTDTLCSTYEYGCTLELDHDIRAKISANGDRVDLFYGDLQIVAEQSGAVLLPEAADILITNTADTRLSAPLTVLQTEDTSDILNEHLHTGEYIFTSDYPVLYLSLHPDGSHTIHEG